MWAKGHAAVLPSYVSTSSYVFAKSPETFSRTLCLLPGDLVIQFALQLVACEGQAVTPEILRWLDHMKVSVDRLRVAIHWYSAHWWTWMLQTRGFDYEGLRQQGSQFEKLLSAWQKEICDRAEDVSRALLEYAATVCQGLSPAFNAVPAGATVPCKTDSEVTERQEVGKLRFLLQILPTQVFRLLLLSSSET